MHISWLGTTAIKLQAKSLEKDLTILIDPYKPKQGAFPRNLAADIVLYTRTEKDSITITGNPFVLSTSGECETGGVLIAAPAGHVPGHTFIRIDAEGMSLAHLGLVNAPLTNTELDVLSDVDILFIPVGGKDTYDASAAVKTISLIEPKIVIPMAYKSDTDPGADSVDVFIKEMGANPEMADKKVIIKQKDLPKEEMRVIVVSKE